MKEKINIYYDKGGDFLELIIGSPRKSHFESLGNDIFRRRNEKTNKISGFIIFNFKKQIESRKETRVELPVELNVSS